MRVWEIREMRDHEEKGGFTMSPWMKKYTSRYGWHFSKEMCDWASSKMYKYKDGKKVYITPYTKEQVDALMKQYNVTLEHNSGYDYVYIANMCKADFYGSSIKDDPSLVLYVKDVIDDADAYDGMPFTRFIADCMGSNCDIPWEDVI